MMEIDSMSYIFGSFARKKSQQPPRISHCKTRSNPQQSPAKTKSPSRAKSVFYGDYSGDESDRKSSEFNCPVCRKRFVDPKVLPCLHTVCLPCLQEMELHATDGGSSGSGVSGYSSSNYSTCDEKNPNKIRRIVCPVCEDSAEGPPEGVSGYPSNYILQHRMVLAAINAQNTHLLCDLCPSEISATSRCMDCALSFCHLCQDLHLRQKSSGHHQVLKLDEARKIGITKVRRQIMCQRHQDLELTTFCTTCHQVVCHTCTSQYHKNHTLEPINRALKTHVTALRIIADRARSCAEKSALKAHQLNTVTKELEGHCSRVRSEVERFIESYVKALLAHRDNVLSQIEEVRLERTGEISRHRTRLHKRVKEARDVAFFLDELLGEGSEVEVMSFVKPVMDRVHDRAIFDHSEDKVNLTDCRESLRFYPKEVVMDESEPPLYGVLSKQAVAADRCVLVNKEGLANLRVGKKSELLLQTMDKDDQPLNRGGEQEQISADIRYRDAGHSRCLKVEVEDLKTGVYRLFFTPDVSGKLVLSVTVKGQAIKDSPFPIIVRTLKPHQGTFHCCTFCSSGGSKEASCGCEGKMPGGYKGCGHGHEGHPGKRHWSCCGNILEHSECGRANPHYQFTL